MLSSLKGLVSYAIEGYDGQLGYVYDFYFDDDTWRARYAVVDTGAWLPGRRVLIPKSWELAAGQEGSCADGLGGRGRLLGPQAACRPRP